VRAVAAFADFLEHSGFLFFRQVGFENDNHVFGCRRPAGTKKPQGRPAADWCLRALTQPQAPVRRFGKVIPTGKAAKRLAERIHGVIVAGAGRASSVRGERRFNLAGSTLELAPIGEVTP
jgi:hypothetical protein